MIERYAINKAIAERAHNASDPIARAAMERDFQGTDWFTSHPRCEPVNEIYYSRFLRGNRARFQRDFGALDLLEGKVDSRTWFTEHPKIAPVSEIYYYDFVEKRFKVHR